MRKFLGVMALSALIFVATGCAADDKESADVAVSDIMDAIKEQMAADMKESFGGEEPLVGGELQGYIEADLTAVDSEDPLVAMFHERLELKEEELSSGIALAPMMNVNSNEIIILKAKEKGHVESLKKALRRELRSTNRNVGNVFTRPI